MSYYSQPLSKSLAKLVDVKKTRRRIEDALRKTATNEEIIFIANLLGVKVEVVKKESCNRCGSIDYVATEDYPQGIFPVGDEILCLKCRKDQLPE
jgi:hypothetical protein